MAKRRLQRWLERREQLHTLLVARHALVRRRPAPERLLQALGLASADAIAADGEADTGRQFVPPMLGLPDAPILAPPDFSLDPYPTVEGELVMAASDVAPGERLSNEIDPEMSDAADLVAPTRAVRPRAVEASRQQVSTQEAVAAPIDPPERGLSAPLRAADAARPASVPSDPVASVAASVIASDQPRTSPAPASPRDRASVAADGSGERSMTDDQAGHDRKRPAADLAIPVAEDSLMESAEIALVDDGRVGDRPARRAADRAIGETSDVTIEPTHHLRQAEVDPETSAGEPGGIFDTRPAPAARAIASVEPSSIAPASAAPARIAPASIAPASIAPASTTLVPVDVPVEVNAARPFPAESSALVNDAAVDRVADAAPTDSEPSAPVAPRPVIEERHTRRAAPPRKGAESRAEGRRPERARQSDPRAPQDPLFETKRPGRSAQDWMRLLVEATAADEPPAPPKPPASRTGSQPLASPPPRRTGAGPARPAVPLRSVSPRPTQTGTQPETQVVIPAADAPPPAMAADTTPLLDATRRFLRPLVGIDPDTVRVHRGVAGEQLASRRRADALTIGEDVVLPPAHAEREAETLGLVAHELTHVARRRDPTFVPPMLHPAVSAPVAGRSTIDDDAARDTSPGATEESIALAVESRVRSAAASATDGGSSPHPMAPAIGAPERDRPRDPRWGTLPAPWEPIIGLPSAPSPTHVPTPEVAPAPGSSAWSGRHAEASRFESETHRRIGRTDSLRATTPVGGTHDAAPGGDVWHADVGRTIEPAPESAAAARPASGAEKPQADIDGLAQQVYAILKRRLAAEQRRGA